MKKQSKKLSLNVKTLDAKVTPYVIRGQDHSIVVCEECGAGKVAAVAFF